MTSSISRRPLGEGILSDEGQLTGAKVFSFLSLCEFIIEKPDSDFEGSDDTQEPSGDEEYDSEIEGSEEEEDLSTLEEANAEREIEGDFE